MTRCYVALILAVMLIWLGRVSIGGQVTTANDTPNVLIDLSHEYSFAFDWDLPWRYLAPAGYDYTRYMASLEPESLNGYDVLVVSQFASGVAFPPHLLEAIRDFVSQGGGLFIVGKGWVWPAYYSGYPPALHYPLHDLAAAFGAELTTAYASKPYWIHPHEVTTGVIGVDTKGCVAGTLALDASWTPLITDNVGQPVMAVRQFGSGRIFLTAEDCILGNPPINTTFMSNIFNWLTHGHRTRYPGYTPLQRVIPELSQTINHVTIHYAASLGDRYQFIQDNFGIVYSHLQVMTSVEPIYDLVILCLATGGGGYSAGQEIGVGVLTADPYVIGVLTHEMAHSWNEPGGFPGAAFEEGWASLMAIRVLERMGYRQEASDGRAIYEAQFRRLDPSGTELDLNADLTGIPLDDLQAYMGKAMWVFETLERNHSNDFMIRLMPLHRHWVQVGRASNPVTLDEFITMLSTVAGMDLRPFFRSIGTHWMGMWKVYLPTVVRNS